MIDKRQSVQINVHHATVKDIHWLDGEDIRDTIVIDLNTEDTLHGTVTLFVDGAEGLLAILDAIQRFKQESRHAGRPIRVA